MDPQQIYAIERPHPKLLTLYILRSLVLPPFSLLGLPVLYFRYHTLRYKFDDEGISMSWGILFRRQVNLTYRRIQDIHLTSGILQRWLGLADIHIQTASGSAAAEMTIEGLLEFEQVRDYLYQRMRGTQESSRGSRTSAGAVAAPVASEASGELVAVLGEIRDELRLARAAIEQRPTGGEG
ncbi:MAG: PH domain-containing protein [Candidatus Sumerlaeia bacterium]|nr:PH domain-containing protein [Candidatus Sumerlaeia bacterium]